MASSFPTWTSVPRHGNEIRQRHGPMKNHMELRCESPFCGSSALYFVFAMALTLMSLTRDQKIVQIKFIIGLVLLVLAMAWGVTKGVILVLLNNEGPLVLSSE